MGAITDFLELPGLRVTVDQVIHQRDAQTPPDRPHCFAYYITIHNDSDVTVTIKARKWVVKNERGEITAVEGDGLRRQVVQAGYEVLRGKGYTNYAIALATARIIEAVLYDDS